MSSSWQLIDLPTTADTAAGVDVPSGWRGSSSVVRADSISVPTQLITRTRRWPADRRAGMGRKQRMDLSDSVALVTGGASGLGLATIRELHTAGAKVAI